MVKNKAEFDESFMQTNEVEILRRKLMRTQKTLDKLKNQINKCA